MGRRNVQWTATFCNTLLITCDEEDRCGLIAALLVKVWTPSLNLLYMELIMLWGKLDVRLDYVLAWLITLCFKKVIFLETASVCCKVCLAMEEVVELLPE